MANIVPGSQRRCRYGGLVWVEESAASMFGQKYALLVNGEIKAQSDDWGYIMDQLNSYSE